MASFALLVVGHRFVVRRAAARPVPPGSVIIGPGLRRRNVGDGRISLYMPEALAPSTASPIQADAEMQAGAPVAAPVAIPITESEVDVRTARSLRTVATA